MRVHVCNLLFRGSWNFSRFKGRIGYTVNGYAHILCIKLLVHFLFLCYCLYPHWIALFLSTWAAARCSWIKPSRAPWGGSWGEQRRIHGHPHQGRHTSNAQHVMFHPWSYGGKNLYIVVILSQALAKLKKIPETIKAIMERLEPELKQIVKRSTTQIADHAYQREESQPR